MRRLAAFVSSLLLLHLTVVGVDRDCDKRGSDAQHAASRATPTAHEHHHGDTTHTHGHGDTGRDTPTLPVCCQALASCGISIAADATSATLNASAIASAIFAAAGDAPRSWSTEPESPPPKA